MGEGATDRPTVLVVADSSFMRRSSVTLLSENGFTVVEAEHGLEAMRLYQEMKPRAAVLDVSGAEERALATLRGITKIDPQARVVMLAARPKEGLVLECVNLGARDFVVKSPDTSRLLQAVCTVASPPTERQHMRVPTAIPATIAFGAPLGAARACTIENLSTGGARCKLASVLPTDNPDAGMTAQLRFALPGHDVEMAMISRVARSIAIGTLAVSFVRVSQDDYDLIRAFCMKTIDGRRDLPAESPAQRSDPAPAGDR